MKFNVDLLQLTEKKTNDRTICIRLPEEDFEKIKNFHSNVSLVLRGLICQFIEQLDQKNKRWIKK